MAYPTTANLKTYLGISSSTDDTILGWANDAAKSYVERETGRVFVAATETRYFPANQPHVLRDKSTLFLHTDLAAITSVTNGDGTVISASDYRAYGVNGSNAPYYKLVLTGTAKANGTRWQNGADGLEIAIAGKWGYSETCPPALFDAMLRLAAHDYRARSSGQSGQITSVSRRSGLVVGQAELPADIVKIVEKFKR